MSEWRCAVRRMARCGLAVALPANSSPAGLAAGAFAVTKDSDADRFIGDRRPMNAQEQMPGPVRLPYAPRLRRLFVPPGRGLWGGRRDLSNCFYLYKVESERLRRQVVGPRVPRAWLEQLEDEALDMEHGCAYWVDADLHAQPGDAA